jgi:hypothetical protein
MRERERERERESGESEEQTVASSLRSMVGVGFEVRKNSALQQIA